jgi:hypothetical protein
MRIATGAGAKSDFGEWTGVNVISDEVAALARSVAMKEAFRGKGNPGK